MKTLSLVLAAMFGVIGSAAAQVKYVDEAGNTHYAQSELMIPEQYRPKAKPVGPLPSVSVPGKMQGGSIGALSQPGGYSGPSRLEREEAQNARSMKDAAERNLLQKQADEAKKAEFNRCVGSKNRVSPCF